MIRFCTRVWGSAALAAVLLLGRPNAVIAKLDAPERSALSAYLTALERGDYPTAFARLSADERRYFASPRNLAAVFGADRLKIEHFTILDSTSAGARGKVVVVRERISFFDLAHERAGTANVNVRYGLIPSPQGLSVKDPFHPWFAFAPSDALATVGGVSVAVRKVAFYTGRIEVLATFANRGDRTVTILPYGRSIVRDDAGNVHTPIRTTLPGLTDSVLYEGLRLPPSAEYTGTMTFLTADRFRPKRLEMTFAPALADGADAPFEFKLPALEVPPAS